MTFHDISVGGRSVLTNKNTNTNVFFFFQPLTSFPLLGDRALVIALTGQVSGNTNSLPETKKIDLDSQMIRFAC